VTSVPQRTPTAIWSITAEMTTAKIRERIHEYLDDISRRYTAKGLYVDREAFDTVDFLIDYSKLKNI